MFDSSHQKVYQLRTSDFDMNLNLKPSSVLDLFQDVACMHAEQLGVGFEDMLKNGMLWVLTKVKYSVIKMPKLYQNVTVKTSVIQGEKLEFVRDYLIYDENGEELIRGTSQWAVISSETRRIMRNPKTYPDGFEYAEKRLFEGKIQRINPFEGEKIQKTVESQITEIDRNGHVNNIRYADYAVNALKFTDAIKTFQIDFHKEVLLGEKIEFVLKQEGKEIFVSGTKDEKVLFCCYIEKGE